MASIDVSLHRRRLLNDAKLLHQLPPEVLDIVRSSSSPNLLDAVAAASLIPSITTQLYIHFEPVFAEICARWTLAAHPGRQDDQVIAAFARVLPFCPHSSVYLERYLRKTSQTFDTTSPQGQPPQRRPMRINSLDSLGSSPELSEAALLQILLAFWRLINFHKRTYGRLAPPSQIQALIHHPCPPVRYLAIRIFCEQVSAADAKLEALVRQHIGPHDSLSADFDGVEIDYTFLSLLEHKRAKELDELRQQILEEDASIIVGESLPEQALTEFVIRYGSTVLPRPNGIPASDAAAMVPTPTTLANLESLAQVLLKPGPILVHGLPGSGKTSVVHELARQLGMESSLVTLHLNEQTDAKMLIGLYSTDSKPGSFSWRPGVLTTAVREGRWVLIEDLDRAPNEIMSTLLPLVERGKLLIPSRGETIEASSSFRLFATVRTTRGMNGQESLPTLLGQRFWHAAGVNTPSEAELEHIILEQFQLLSKYTPMIMAVFKRVSALPSTHGGRSATERPITPRDLFKWCRRIQELLVAAGCATGEEPISDTTRGWIFMEAVDCFCGSFAKVDNKAKVVQSIAEDMQLPEQLVQHYLFSQIPQLEETPTQFRVGRAALPRRQHASKIVKSKKTFANTNHAKRLLESIAAAVKLKEPVLLVGETGIGKTTVVQQLSDQLGHKLVAVNLSQQSEAGDLLGGFKPVNARSLAVPLKEEFEDLFASTGISATRNQKYLESLGKQIAKGQWTRVSKLWREAPKMFNEILKRLQAKSDAENEVDEDGRPAPKRRKTGSQLDSLLNLKPRWEAFDKSLDQFDIQISGGSGSFAFAFVEGNIVKAARNGDWVLLDEINLASPDTLESIADLLSSGPDDSPSILLTETGEIERVTAHPDFRIFAAMNPATDVGKRDLPQGLRSRFTEFYVGSPDRDLKDLLTIIKAYLSGKSSKDDQAADDIARLYMSTKQRAEEKRLVDGANEVPHFSLRTLTRVLTYVNDVAPSYGLRRALFEGFSMGFLTLLDRASEETLIPLIHHYLLDKHGSAKSILSQPPRHPSDGKVYVKFINRNKDRQYWLLQGMEVPQQRSDYIITPYVERNLLNLVRATSTRRFPILIQGPTSAGKTSMIEYLANYSGNKFVRINNHEHTDLQEYLGTYVSDSDGKLRFQEGLLVQALRQGHWIVLDELNLAPTDVLEALNRLLDDNRELLIPETQEVVRPHENFMLFATQNPPGLYGGRKALSRAFRNRFLELHFDDIPEEELETILQKRSIYTSPSDCKRIVSVYKELSRLRQTSRLFENKDSFATLRDLFRWALRGAQDRQEIAVNGFMLLAERVRNEEERLAVKNVVESVFKVKIDPLQLYDAKSSPILAKVLSSENAQGVVWTYAMRRLYVLVASALRHNEPVLLVGDTGCGKTTVCQLLAEALGKELHIVNAHQNTETGDLIGSQRPIRNRGAIGEALFADLKTALSGLQQNTDGSQDDLLARYKSLQPAELADVPAELQQKIADNEVKSKALFEWADGSLVQSMRDGQFFLLDEISLADDSVLERLNSVLEPGRTLLLAEKGISDSFIKASDEFQFLATMNPGGDFGKKELSPALRNRFTEIWVPPLSGNSDILQIISSKLRAEFRQFSQAIVDFAYWFGQSFRSTTASAFSIRDILVWVKFINSGSEKEGAFSVIHGAATVFIDTIGANPSALIAIDPKSLDSQRQTCLDKLTELLGVDATAIYRATVRLSVGPNELQIGPFSIARESDDNFEAGFALHAPTTKLNAMRIIRALRVQKPILLEGSPGVGKTTLVSALALEGAEAGHFAWRDAPFLRAMQNGEWVLLDEMNLASQSVLEGLNACLDHRGEVYVSELDQVFKRHPDFRLFAAQNPHHQGGGRKGLPSSFVNRFIVVYADVFTEEDLLLIAQHNFPNVPADVVRRMIHFISELEDRILVQRAFGSQGSPWEFNLRDTLRWLNLLNSSDPLISTAEVDDFLRIAIQQRFRSENDRVAVANLFTEIFEAPPKSHQVYHNASAAVLQVGLALLERNQLSQPLRIPPILVVPRLAEIESLLISVKHNIPSILVGPSGSGKSMLLEYVAAMAGKSLITFPMNADIDAMDLVGGFEQSDPLREANAALKDLREALQTSILTSVPQVVPETALDLFGALDDSNTEHAEKVQALLPRVKHLQSVIAADSDLAEVLRDACAALQRSTTITDPRFEWLDGIIVHALEKGEWLVLDNANLCSASVLDRLNSLLEPNGFLIINEHCGPNGEPRIVKPHPDFRIFLTVDPRYGELSRAMRNRAIEIYVEPTTITPIAWSDRLTKIEPSLQRFDLITSSSDFDAINHAHTAIVASESLSASDMVLLERWPGLNGQTLLHREATSIQVAKRAAIDASLSQITALLKLPTSRELLQALRDLYNGLADRQLTSLVDIQPLHPLQNNPVVRALNTDGSNLSFWLATCLELYQALLGARTALEAERAKAGSGQVSTLNRLQRSCLADTVAAVAKDSTLGAVRFLHGMLQTVEEFLRAELSDGAQWRQRRTAMQHVMHVWWTTFQNLIEPRFEEAHFQAHLAHITQVLSSQAANATDEPTRQVLSQMLQGLESCFVAGFRLTTGLEMEHLWQFLRPLPIKNSEQLSNVTEMMKLASRFDMLKWTTKTSPAELAKVTDLFVESYHLARRGTGDFQGFLEIVDQEIQKLAHLQGSTKEVKPFFTQEFESLRRLIALEDAIHQDETSWKSSLSSDLVLLANLSLFHRMSLQSATPLSKYLQSLDAMLGSDRLDRPWNRSVAAQIMSRLNAIDSANLNSLASIELEMPLLTKQVGLYSHSLTEDHLKQLSELLWAIMIPVVKLYDSALAAAFHSARDLQNSALAELLRTVKITEKGVVFDPATVITILAPVELGHLSDVARQHLLPAFVSLVAAGTLAVECRTYLANAWLQFAVAMIKLFVPDKTFDPQLRPLVELKSYEDLLRQLTNRLEALQQFSKLHTGQSADIRSSLVAEEIVQLGNRPLAVQTVYRPPRSQLPELQNEFNSLLKTVVGVDLGMVLGEHYHGSESATQQLDVVFENILQIIYRLQTRFVAYEDITIPVVGMLHCLQIGLSLRDDTATCSKPQVEASSSVLLKHVPLFGSGNIQTHAALPQTAEYLALVGTYTAVEGQAALAGSLKHTVFQTIHGFFAQWTQQLEADRKAEENKTSMYRYRAGQSEEEAKEEQEFNELFPTFGEDEQVQAQNASPRLRDTRGLAIKIAALHKNIFVTSQKPLDSIRALVMLIAKKIVAEGGVGVDDRKMMPALLWILDEKQQEFTSVGTPAGYNFYTDRNMPEARKLVAIVNDIRAKFQQLQQVDEIAHMQPLVEVISACDKVTELSHANPLAMIIPKVEQLHAFVYEWQFGGWASHVYGALPLYNRLTDMIISWRRLELSTWSKLFDMETEKQDNDAASWWFVAYQAIIAGPMGIVRDGGDMASHARDLLTELEVYFSSAPVGQFAGRLELLKQLLKQLDLLITDEPSMALIRDGVQNFVSYYARYEKSVTELIRAGRAPIDKQMKDVLLLASWKDTNIVALRESARKSHQKLFRIVRKFREVLNQPMKSVIEQGLPDEEVVKAQSIADTTEVAQIDDSANSVCRKDIKQWSDKHKRLANSQRTVDIMARMTRYPEAAIDAVTTIDSFLANLETSASELRKETPPFLTDENKNLVKHLKTRKRKLFADVLKDLRQMGFSYNLGVVALNKQATLPLVLSTSKPFLRTSSASFSACEYYLHKILDLAPRARAAAQSHSDDLTQAEIARSVGFLEGILHVVLAQRQHLAVVVQQNDALSSARQHIVQIAKLKSGTQIRARATSSDYGNHLTWLMQIIPVGLQLIEIHGRFSKVDNSRALRLLQAWLDKIAAIKNELKSCVVLPSDLITAHQLDREAHAKTILSGLRGALDEASIERPDLAFVLDQVRQWTDITEHPTEDRYNMRRNLTALAEACQRLCDGILVTIERFNKELLSLPADPEAPGWLAKHNDAISSVSNALCIDQIERSINETVETFKAVDLANSNINKVAASLMAVVVPIVETYQTICIKTVQRYCNLHLSTCRLGYTLSKSFIQLAGQGFCTPQEKSDETSGETGELESGTGLGEGEGAEDISKDVQPDEDLTDLAQEANKEPNKEMEEEQDAVDMADQELAADMEEDAGAEDEKDKDDKSGDEDEEGDEMEEEAGNVDDLDPSAVDEKMWDGENEEDAEKDQQGEQTKGQQKKDEKMAAEDDKGGDEQQDPEQGEEDEEAADEMGADQDEDVKLQEDINRQDQNVQEQEALALPDDMDIDGNDDDDMSSISDDELDKLSDVEKDEDGADDAEDRDLESEDGGDGETDMVPGDEEKDGQDEQDEGEDDEDNANIQEDEQAEAGEDDPAEDEDKEKHEMPSTDDADASNDNTAPSDVKSSGQDQTTDQDDNKDGADDSAAQRDGGEMGESATDQDQSVGDKGSVSKTQDQPTQADADDLRDSAVPQPFKALGDAMEKWHRQRREIKEAQEKDTNEPRNDAEQESAVREYQHLQNDDDAAETQAMGTANEEQGQKIDESMAIDDEEQPVNNQIMPEEEAEQPELEEQPEKMDTSEPSRPEEQPQQETAREDRRTGVSTRQGAFDRDTTPPSNGAAVDEDVEETIQETSHQLDLTHLSDPEQLRDFDESLQQWTSFQTKTHPLSLSLTSQLRLILTPSQSTKLSGSFRTGKRLNIKRIIPYIASSYKRDKIWMRRAIPTKRTYQIMLCVDDSKSMGESSAGSLALESLVMVSRALTMLEVGQIGVLGFGANTFMAHEFAEPFASHDAGAKVLQKFSFDQDYTDIQLLIRQTIERFRQARTQQGGSRGSEDLWQLALILSDGLTPSAAHEEIKVLLREALEERIMIVFIIMDDTSAPAAAPAATGNGSGGILKSGGSAIKSQSVLNLKKVRFLGNDEIKTEYYLDTFPFQYYLIVHNLEDLPGALAGLLRTWFAEVNA
ncbi:ATPase protein [Microdochium trichocladiopsis]|uniref:Midasin n=1 Tax=Microdochium trichocladiopsis TaxID=1682393 RepID=A0A9P8YC90_9PEZI|nr:ATPase protein [Microdochium trichocladiopsis]KAH7038086.1 ATPase protein [Microdochium trichocladiopsis]